MYFLIVRKNESFFNLSDQLSFFYEFFMSLAIFAIKSLAFFPMNWQCPQQIAAAHQAPLSMDFSRQEYWSGLPFPFPGDLPDPEIEPRSPISQADSLPLSHWRRAVLEAIKAEIEEPGVWQLERN